MRRTGATWSGASQACWAAQALGYSVWRDDELPADRDYSAVIEERLRGQRAGGSEHQVLFVKRHGRPNADVQRDRVATFPLPLASQPS